MQVLTGTKRQITIDYGKSRLRNKYNALMIAWNVSVDTTKQMTYNG